MEFTLSTLANAIGGEIIWTGASTLNGIAYDSRKVMSGDVFFCLPGEHADGCSFVENAIDNGAKCIVCENPQKLPILGIPELVSIIVVRDARAALADAACFVNGNPSEALSVFAVTGTNGKTTVSYLVQEMLESLGTKTGIIGTVHTFDGNEDIPSVRTTPEAPEFQALLTRMVENGCGACSCEVSSHALSLERVHGTMFTATAFTNLSQDHLDYYHDMENYFAAKALLFGEGFDAARVINLDDEHGRALRGICSTNGDDIVTYSAEGEQEADLRCMNAESVAGSTTIKVGWRDGVTATFSYPLVGKFNVENMLCAMGCLLATGVPFYDVIHAAGSTSPAPGRMEVVTLSDGTVPENAPTVVVDYAHTPDALDNVLDTVNALPHSDIICVFGAGGDRDATKRPLMGQAVATKADVAYVTSDNPRTEEPRKIMDGIMEGIDDMSFARAKVIPIEDRRDAIRHAIEHAGKDSIVVIAGKGHEDYQEVNGVKHHFDDREEARKVLEELQ